MPSFLDKPHVATDVTYYDNKWNIDSEPLMTINGFNRQPVMSFRLVNDHLVIEGDVSHASEAANVIFNLLKNMVDIYIDKRLNDVEDTA